MQMTTKRARVGVAGAVLVLAVAGVGTACSNVLGLGEYGVGQPPAADASGDEGDLRDGAGDVGPSDAASEDTGPSMEAGPNCTVDLTKTCFPCTPTSEPQLLNQCTGAKCFPFDEARVTKRKPDGTLPDLPQTDGG
jgi:hypothetical protein